LGYYYYGVNLHNIFLIVEVVCVVIESGRKMTICVKVEVNVIMKNSNIY